MEEKVTENNEVNKSNKLNIINNNKKSSNFNLDKSFILNYKKI